MDDIEQMQRVIKKFRKLTKWGGYDRVSCKDHTRKILIVVVS